METELQGKVPDVFKIKLEMRNLKRQIQDMKLNVPRLKTQYNRNLKILQGIYDNYVQNRGF